MDSFAEVIQIISEKVDKLNAAIESLEAEYYQKSVNEKAAYAEDKKRASLLGWLRQFKTPTVALPEWHQERSNMDLRALLDAEHIDVRELAAKLNLYALNVAIESTRLKAGKELVLQAEELRQISAQIHSVNISEKA